MVQNAGSFLKYRQDEKRKKPKTVVIYLLFDLHFR